MIDNSKRVEIDDLMMRWLAWLYTRRFYAAPIPQNMLVRMIEQNSKQTKLPPDAKNCALCSAWNLVLQDASENDDSFIAFMFVYLKAFRPYKIARLAIERNVSTDTIYLRGHSAALKYYNKALMLERLHNDLQKEIKALEYD